MSRKRSELQRLHDEITAGRAFVDRGEWRKAARSARRVLLSKDAEPWARAVCAGGILIDAGADAKRGRLIHEGVRAIAATIDTVPQSDRFAALYNLATGLVELGQRERGWGPGARPALHTALRRFDDALACEDSAECRVNLGNCLSSQGRFVEALDEYDRVIAHDREHHEAYANRASTLETVRRWTQPGHHGFTEAAAVDIETAITLSAGDPLYRERYQRFRSKLKRRAPTHGGPPVVPSPIAEWVWSNRLNLNLCPLCRQDTPEAYDLYSLFQHLTSPRRRPSAAELLSIVNTVHRSFASARALMMLADGVGSPIAPAHVITQSPTDPSGLTLRTGFMLAAASSFYGVLNQVSFGLNSYLHLGHEANVVNFERIWSRPSKQRPPLPKRKREFHPRFARSSSLMLNAIYGIALSFDAKDGRYSSLRRLRNDIEHHLVVVDGRSKESSYFAVYRPAQLRVDVLALGRLAKAAVLYFGGAIWMEEVKRLRKKQRGGKYVTGGYAEVQRL